MLGESTDDYLGRREREREQQRAADLVTGPAVYLIGPRPPHLGFVKIVITKHLAERLKQLEAASTVPLHVMAGFDGDEAWNAGCTHTSTSDGGTASGSTSRAWTRWP
ncbi:hypothetical protein [Streptomyces zaomyceticus]|uniref:hypothetical protein n=1 Tax=Streptomyces zaomyceticus TaxID=68286 RepID=UPI0033BD55AA